MFNAQGADVSKWDEAAIDYERYRSLGSFAMIKVSEGLVKDPLFDEQWAAGRGKTIRSPYHFWRSFVDQKQAVHNLLEFLGDDPGELPASLDLEVSDGSTQVMALAKVWVDEYHRLTGLWPYIYSTRGFLHENGADYQGVWDKLKGTYRNQWLSSCRLWLAEWPFDEINSLPGYSQVGDGLRAALIQEVIDGKRTLPWPHPIAPFGFVEIWQWTSRYPPGQIPGYFMGANHKLAVDMNIHMLARAIFDAAHPIPSVEPSVPDQVSQPYPGVKVTCGRRFGTDVQVIEVDPKAIASVIVTAPGAERIAEEIPGDIISNGGDFDMTTLQSVGYLVSQGHEYSPPIQWAPALAFTPAGIPYISELVQNPTLWPNAVGLNRWLVVEGAVSPNTSDAWDTVEPRKVYGVKPDGTLIILSTKGRQPDQAGLDLHQAAAVMIEFGAQSAGDGDSGKSVQTRIKGYLFTGTTDRRPVADFVRINIQQAAPGGTPMGSYTAKVVLETAVRMTPSITGQEVGARLEPGFVFTAQALKVVKPGLEEWLELPDGSWTAAVYPNSLGLPKVFVTYFPTGDGTPAPTPTPTAEPIVTIVVNTKQAAVHVEFSDGRKGDVTVA